MFLLRKVTLDVFRRSKREHFHHRHVISSIANYNDLIVVSYQIEEGQQKFNYTNSFV